ncbi:MAG: ATP citrate lyase citrate-binding domain-containing protein [Phycisphaerae bacterium]|jgi:succinyl-CoA synthetase beta subunit|nr:ATP citrate lyase citrate-binding domain-containing protein [Phycisphaerae bacterium]
MPAKVTELFFLEHLAPRFGISVPEHLTADAPGAAIREALERWGGRGLVKADVLSGKRGKSGAVVEVTDYVDAQKELKRVQGIEVGGHLPRTAYIVQHIPSDLEVYAALTYDSRHVGPAITMSLSGGMDIEEVTDDKKITSPIDIYKWLDAYQASDILQELGCPAEAISPLSRSLVDFVDMFRSTGMQLCEVNPWRIDPQGKPFACDFKAIFDEANFKFRNLGLELPEYPANKTAFEEEMSQWSASSHQGQAHVADLGGELILPILFGGGASTIVIETLTQNGGSPLFLSDFGGNPTYERMFGTAKRCFDHNLSKASAILILGGKANNTLIDVTFKAIADALIAYVDENGPISTPVVVGRGGPRLVQGLLTMKETLDALSLPYVIFGPDTPVTQVAEYAAGFAKSCAEMGDVK